MDCSAPRKEEANGTFSGARCSGCFGESSTQYHVDDPEISCLLSTEPIASTSTDIQSTFRIQPSGTKIGLTLSFDSLVLRERIKDKEIQSNRRRLLGSVINVVPVIVVEPETPRQGKGRAWSWQLTFIVFDIVVFNPKVNLRIHDQ
ncbi:hypothetical protein D9758_018751 [Tetrapyrgos nigripes]|uniref:Uncharacterized protein n=1 Tax=Tetrapyrgos nigripes TaxID=182062 RepID=A0A8H5EYZ3_9AGAR|nr:hypothetical protein D9758_018751 [Tetrapyrgos nigripes]